MEDMKKYIAEFIGTCVLTTFGCGTAVGVNTLVKGVGIESPLAFNTLVIAFAFGLSIVAMAYSIGNVSGCHINPAVSLACFMTKRMSLKDFIWYVVAQCLGACVGALILVYLFGAPSGLGSNGYGLNSAIGITMTQAIVVEIILTFVFVTTILGVTSKDKFAPIAGLVIGLTLTFVHILGIPLTGTSVNPARSLVALFAGSPYIEQLPVFIIAPLVGAALAALVHNFLQKDEAK